jgi:subtilisin family serine protease
MFRHEAVGAAEAVGATPSAARAVDGSLAGSLIAHGAIGWRPALRSRPDRTCAGPGPNRAARLVQRATRRGIQHSEGLPHLDDVFLVEFGSEVDVRVVARVLSAHPDVAYAEPNWVFRIQATPLPDVGFVPNDRFVSSDDLHWSENAFGNSFPDLWGVDRVRALEAWNHFDVDGSGGFEPGELRPGEDVLVAVIDSGLDAGHPDMVGSVFINPGEIPENGVDDDANGFIDDVSGWDFVNDDRDPHDGHGHGSHVSGTIAARADNAIGLVGIAPWASILPVKALSDSGRGDVQQIANAIRYAADMGADVLSNSWGGPGDSQTIADAFEYADGLGAVSVAAAGNSSTSTSIFTPAKLESVIAVAALGPDDTRAFFSNYGPGTDLAAPGTDVLSVNANGGDNWFAESYQEFTVEGDYLVLQGTSMACPHVTGAAAVILSQYPEAGPAEVRGRLLAGAASIAAANPSSYSQLGRGRVDVRDSLLVSPRPVYELAGVDTGELVHGAQLDLVVRIVNRWTPASGVAAQLVSMDSGVVIHEGNALLGDIGTDMEVSNVESPFRISLDGAVPFGTRLFFDVALESASGEVDRVPFFLVVPFFHDIAAQSGLPISGVIPLQASIEDYDGDGAADVRVIDPLRTHFFRNLGDGSFEDTRISAGVTFPGIGQAHSLLFDSDNDGDRDLLVGGFSESHFYEHSAPGRFVNVTAASGFQGLRSYSAVSFDWDGDGLLDVVGATDSGLYLMRSGGDGSFADLADLACLPTGAGVSFGQIHAFDFDGDGDMDLLLGAQGNSLRLYRNEGDGTFSDATRDAGLTPTRNNDEACRRHGRFGSGRRCPSNPAIGFATGDIDSDGDLDLFVTRGAFADSRRVALFRNEGRGRFVDVSAEMGDSFDIDVYGLGWGDSFFDLDNDGDLDLLITSDRGGDGLSHHVFRNRGDGHLERVTEGAFTALSQPLGAVVAVGDLDDDGGLDFFTPEDLFNAGSRGCVCENRVAQSGHWVKVALAGVVSPAEPYGARVYVTTNGATQLREMHISAVEPQSLHFGLGDAVRADVEVHWPSGLVQLLRDQPVDREIRIQEPAQCLSARGPDCADVAMQRELREPLDFGAIPACADHGRPDDKPLPGSKAREPKAEPSE